MRKFEHVERARFWTIRWEARVITVLAGEFGTPGEERRVTDYTPARKAEDMIAKIVAMGYREVFDASTIVAPMKETERWFAHVAQGDRSLAIAAEGRRYWLWRDGASEPTQDRGLTFDDAKEEITLLLEEALANGMRWVPDARDPITLAALAKFVANAELEAACRAAPDDPAPWSVYADYLLQHEDPRGEHAALAQAGKARPPRKELFGDFDPTRVEITEWRHGFPRAATIRMKYEGVELAELTRDFLALPLAIFVESVRFGVASFENGNDWKPTLDRILAWPHADQIRSVRFDAFDSSDQEISWVAPGDLSGLWQLPALEYVVIAGGGSCTLGAIDAPRLKHFDRYTGGLSSAEISACVGASWPALEHLDLYFGRDGYGAEGDVMQIMPILRGERLPALKHLGIINCEFTASVLQVLLTSPLLPRLTELDLSMGIMYEREFELLLANADRFRHLAKLDVEENYLAPAWFAQLQRALPNLVGESQREPEDIEEGDDTEWRYAALGE